MEKTYSIAGCLLRVQWTQGVVRIINDYGLHQLLAAHTEERTAALVERIKTEYEQDYQQSLQINADSLSVEIWAHVYAERFFAQIHHLLGWQLSRRLYHFIRERCRVIDCGESNRDSNRWVWNILGKKKNWVFLLLRRRLQTVL